MREVTRWYDAPEKIIAAKGAIVRTYHGSGRAVVKITGDAVLLDYLEQTHRLKRRPFPPVIGDP